MAEWLQQFAPNVVEKFPELIESFWQTLVMMGGSGVISFFFGLIFGVALIVTRPGGVLQNGLIYGLLDKAVNLFRSIPFIILIAALIPLTRLVSGTAHRNQGRHPSACVRHRPILYPAGGERACRTGSRID